MFHTLGTKLPKVGEHGLGRCVIVLQSGYEFKHTLALKEHLGNERKLEYFFVDLTHHKEYLSLKLIETINHYHFAKSLLIDYPAFEVLINSISKLGHELNNFHKIIIFNPVSGGHKFMKFFQKYITLDASSMLFPKVNKSKLYSNLDFLRSHEVSVVGLQDNKYALKLAATFHNSSLHITTTYTEAIQAIKCELSL